MSLPSLSSYTLCFLRYSLDKLFPAALANAYQPAYLATIGIAHLQPLTNVPATYQLPTPYGCRDITQTMHYRSRSLRKGQR